MKKIRVFLSDDHAILREGLISLINHQEDMEVVGQASNGLEAIEGCQHSNPDVAVIDLSMPQCNGLKAIKQIRKLCPLTRIIVLTMHDDQTYLRSSLAAGCAGYLIKSVASKDLIIAIREIHRGRSFIRISLTEDSLTEIIQEVPLARSRRKRKTLLTPRENEVLEYLVHGFTNREIAEKLGIKKKSVDTYRLRLQEKLGLKSRADLVRYALEIGIFGGDHSLPDKT